jgi:large subunit ribosomal protein L4
MLVPVCNTSGETISSIELDEGVFGLPFNEAVVHQALVRQLANARLGTASTKTRGEVAKSTRKLFSQKHTGRARGGSRRSPLLRGGGVIFGPHPHSYRQRMPKKMRRLALKCTLSAKLRDDEIKVIDDFGLAQPKAKEMAQILKNLVGDSSALIVTPEPEVNVIRASRNLPRVKTLPAALLNVTDLLSCKFLIITVEAVHRVEQIWGKNGFPGKMEMF